MSHSVNPSTVEVSTVNVITGISIELQEHLDRIITPTLLAKAVLIVYDFSQMPWEEFDYVAMFKDGSAIKLPADISAPVVRMSSYLIPLGSSAPVSFLKNTSDYCQERILRGLQSIAADYVKLCKEAPIPVPDKWIAKGILDDFK